MEANRLRLRTAQLQDQENSKKKPKRPNSEPAKKQGLAVRGALGDITAQVQRDINVGKVAFATAKTEKKSNTRPSSSKTYSHVQPKVDTWRVAKKIHAQPTSKQGEVGTSGLASAQNWEISKENINTKNSKKTTKTKPVLKIDEKTQIKNLNESKKQPSLENQSVKEFNLDLDNTPELPEDIEDIDAEDSKLMPMAVYIKDFYRNLPELEDKFPIRPDYMKDYNDINPKMRAILIDWLVDVHQELKLLQESLQITVAIIDRYLQETPHIQRNQLQLVGVTALCIACKYEEVFPPNYSFFIGNGTSYTMEDLLRCEREIIVKLRFCFSRPPPLCFVSRYVKAAHGDQIKYNLSKYFVEHCLVDYSMVHYKPSELSAAAVCLSLHLLTGQTLFKVWNPTLTYYSGYAVKDLVPIIRRIANIVVNNKKSAVYNKYMNDINSNVASLPELKKLHRLQFVCKFEIAPGTSLELF